MNNCGNGSCKCAGKETSQRLEDFNLGVQAERASNELYLSIIALDMFKKNFLTASPGSSEDAKQYIETGYELDKKASDLLKMVKRDFSKNTEFISLFQSNLKNFHRIYDDLCQNYAYGLELDLQEKN